MNRWLVKTEPATYSFQALHRDRRTVWDGVKNALALKHLGRMRRGDLVLVYHTGTEKAAVGVARVAADPYADPTKKDPKLLVVELAAEGELPRPVTLAELRGISGFEEFDLLRLPRLSVMPVSASHWSLLESLAKRAAR